MYCVKGVMMVKLVYVIVYEEYFLGINCNCLLGYLLNFFFEVEKLY